VGESIGRDDPVGRQQEPGQEYPLPEAAEFHIVAVVDRRHRAKYAVLHHPPLPQVGT
jgi:hypothetical protein